MIAKHSMQIVAFWNMVKNVIINTVYTVLANMLLNLCNVRNIKIRKFRIVTLETSIIRIIKFSRSEWYLPLPNDAILCQWHYYIPNFKFLTLPTLPTPFPIKWNFGNAKHFKLYNHMITTSLISDFSLKCRPPYN